jgi:hypothetical protein
MENIMKGLTLNKILTTIWLFLVPVIAYMICSSSNMPPVEVWLLTFFSFIGAVMTRLAVAKK